jgi:hypothetical protein
VADQVEGEVERRDGGHHPDRHPLDQAQAPVAGRAGVEGHHLPGQGPGHAGREPQHLDRRGDLSPGGADGLGRLAGDDPGEELPPLLQHGGGPFQDPRPPVGAEAGTPVPVEGHAHRLVDVGDRQGRHHPDQVAVPRGADLEDGIALHRLAVDAGGGDLAGVGPVEQLGRLRYHFTMTCLSSV